MSNLAEKQDHFFDEKYGGSGTQYGSFVDAKTQASGSQGFEPIWMPEYLFDFQHSLTSTAIEEGRFGIFADCGLGKTAMQLVWAQNVHLKTGKPVLLAAPLAVAAQTVEESKKFQVEAARSTDGKITAPITVVNYERLHYFDRSKFGGMVCDESSILKSFAGARRQEITDFMRKMPYRLLATATAAPNDYIELGTSSEALGYLGHMDMLNRFFKNDNNNSGMKRHYGEAPEWRFKGHAEQAFWRWVTSWARACRKPSDLGFDDSRFVLPEITEQEHLVKVETAPDGMLFNLPAVRLDEQREERKRTLNQRCDRAASLVNETKEPALMWCHMNAEGDLLEKIIPDAEQVSGSDSDEEKERKFLGFANGEIRVLITKPKIGAWGLNFQHCAHIVYFPSHSYEAYYQAVRRCWRFGQKRPVKVDIVLTEGERRVMENLQSKANKAYLMFTNLVAEMNNAVSVDRTRHYNNQEIMPKWL